MACAEAMTPSDQVSNERLVAFIPAVLPVLTTRAVLVEEGEGSVFEQVLLRKGTLIEKEFYTLSVKPETVTAEAVVLTDMTDAFNAATFPVEYTKYAYVGNPGMKVATYHSGNDEKVLIRFDGSAYVCMYVDKIDSISALFEEARVELNSL